MAKRKDVSSGETETSTTSDSASPTAATASAPAEAVAPPEASKPQSAEAAKPGQPDQAEQMAPPATTTAPSRRFLQLAAALALAAALGAVLGSLGSAGIAQLLPQSTASAAASNSSFAHESRSLRQLAVQLAADVTALKQSVAAANRGTSSQFAKLAERIEQAQAAPAARLAKITEALDRLERRVATETTGSIATRQAVPTPPLPPEKPAVVSGWVLREIFDGRALVENRHEIYEIGPGSNLPGLGRVETIKRQDGRWVVVTAKGLIVSSR